MIRDISYNFFELLKARKNSAISFWDSVSDTTGKFDGIYWKYLEEINNYISKTVNSLGFYVETEVEEPDLVQFKFYTEIPTPEITPWAFFKVWYKLTYPNNILNVVSNRFNIYGDFCCLEGFQNTYPLNGEIVHCIVDNFKTILRSMYGLPDMNNIHIQFSNILNSATQKK